MKDPYQILGISRNASDAEIKETYRKLVRKYHPDKYISNPLEDLAAEKMAEINHAYETIVKERRQFSENQSNAYSYEEPTNSQFKDIRAMIKNGRLVDAEEILDGVPSYKRDGEWYFLKGTVFYSRGYIDEAYSYFQKATSMCPDCNEYSSAFLRMDEQRRGFSQNQYRTQSSQCNACDICTGLMVADCCCECLGGDLIACC